jgi:formate--tetrahydrofolate ligase
MADHWAEGAARPTSRSPWSGRRQRQKQVKLLYPDERPLLEKIRTIAQQIYRAKDITADKTVRDQLEPREDGYGRRRSASPRPSTASRPIPIQGRARRPHDPGARGALSAGAEFVVAICGEIMTMPGLPRVPAADMIDVAADGKIVGLF